MRAGRVGWGDVSAGRVGWGEGGRGGVRSKSHRKVFPVVPSIFRAYRSIAVNCEQCLCPKSRMHKMERCTPNCCTSTRDIAETHLSPRTEGL